MGSFNVSGGMSHISIGSGDSIVFIPLACRQYGSKEGVMTINPSTMLVSNDGAEQFFSPRFLPIRGEYDDYGSVEEVVRDANVEYIEEYFGITIEQFFDHITRNWCNDDKTDCRTEALTTELSQMSGMFELAEVYDTMLAGEKASDSVVDSEYIGKDNLELVGFEYYSDQDTQDERFKYMLRHKDLPDFEFHSDGRWTHMYHCTTREQHSCYHFTDLNKLLVKLKLPTIDLTPLGTGSVLRSRIYKDIGKNVNITVVDGEEFTAKEAEQKTLELLVKCGNGEELTDEEQRTFKTCMEITRPISNGYDLDRKYRGLQGQLTTENADGLEDVLYFARAMWGTNNIYMPNFNGAQCGEPAITLKLAKLCVKISEKELKRWDD